MLSPAPPLAGDETALPATVVVAGVDLPVWPAGQVSEVLYGAQIAGTIFADHAVYAAALTEAVLLAERDPRFHYGPNMAARGNCGSKAYDLSRWNVPAASLIHGRALMLAHHTLGQCAVFADDAWASVYRDGAYCMPHSHLRSEVSVLYMLDPGEPDPGRSVRGPAVLQRPAHRMVLPQSNPVARPGRRFHGCRRARCSSSRVRTCIIVNPYHGHRPRITLSWNVTRQRLPGSPRPPRA